MKVATRGGCLGPFLFLGKCLLAVLVLGVAAIFATAIWGTIDATRRARSAVPAQREADPKDPEFQDGQHLAIEIPSRWPFQAGDAVLVESAGEGGGFWIAVNEDGAWLFAMAQEMRKNPSEAKHETAAGIMRIQMANKVIRRIPRGVTAVVKEVGREALLIEFPSDGGQKDFGWISGNLAKHPPQASKSQTEPKPMPKPSPPPPPKPPVIPGDQG